MREVELKGIAYTESEAAAARAGLEAAGATLSYEGRLEDRRYDTPDRALALRDHVLRLRVYRGASVVTSLDFKGPTGYAEGFKVRDEYTVNAGDPVALAQILEALGYVITREIDRHIAQFSYAGATVRFERYPRMDVLIEVEGETAAIEQAIVALGLPRERFTAQRLPDFVLAYESRTGQRAALCDRELDGEYRYSPNDA
ncbi:MAG: CYTH domain-containing protein [Gemmatimonadaceae bacterium]|nr:CYTH domain-containing protein [Gemmatimonadaceae bacterium]MCW5825830.1 CYTH domain-containing protein [Gemmatimonadaceae bacterium]